MTFDPSLFAIGGIAAAIAAGWQQFKTAVGYVSSFIVVRASFDYKIAAPVGIHLRTNWKPLPSGLLVYIGRWFNFRNTSRTKLVPFRIPAPQNIYVRRWAVIIASGTSELTLTALRWTVNFDRLVSAALDDYEDRLSEIERPASRFQVERCMGREKGLAALAYAGRGSDKPDYPQGEIATTQPSASPDNRTIDLLIDRSFKYAHEDYALSDGADPLDGLFFEPPILRLVEEAAQWKSLGEWYAERGLPWRRGWLLHGPGGTGKSSLARATAQKLGVPLYVYYLPTLSDREFVEFWTQMQTPCVALFEDFDAVFDGRSSTTEHKSLTFDTVLNQISGVQTTQGVLLIVTTNRLEKIDPAMGVVDGPSGVSTRPGRLDAVVEFGEMSTASRRRLADRTLRDWPDEIAGAVAAGESMTPAQFQELCVRRAFELLAHAPEAAPRLRLVS